MAEMRAKLGLDNAQFNTGLQQAQVRLKEFNEKLANPGNTLAGWGKNLPVIGGIIGLIAAGIATVRAFGEGIEKAFSLSLKRQELIAQFTAFYGSVDKARDKLAEFSAYAASTPFKTDEVARGARVLEQLSEGALSGKHALEVVGDVAAGTNQPFEEVAKSVGLLYTKLSSGDNISRPLLALQRMGAIAPSVAGEIKDMAAAGEPMAAIWQKVEGSLDRFKGTTEALDGTFDGSVERMNKSWNGILAKLGAPIVDAITPWAKLGADALEYVKNHFTRIDDVVKMLASGVVVLWSRFITGARNAWDMLQTAYTGFTLFVNAVETGTVAVAVALAQVMEGNVKDAVATVRRGWKDVTDAAAQAGDKLEKIHQATAAANEATNAAAWQSLSNIWNGIEPPPAPKVDAPAEDIDEQKTATEDLTKKEQELADLRAHNAEAHLSDLERINSLTQQRVQLLKDAQELEQKAADLDKQKENAGAAKITRAKAVENQIAAEKLLSEIGDVQATRDERIAALKQKITEHDEKLLTGTQRILALQKEKASLDLDNADEEKRLKAQARAGEIDDQIAELTRKKSDTHFDEGRRLGLGGIKGVDYAKLAGGDDLKQQTKLQNQMVASLRNIESKIQSGPSVVPIARFGS